MSILTDFTLLEYLHDAGCNSFVWDCSDRSMRRIVLVVHVDDDAEYEPWKGRVVTLTFFDVVMCRFVGWGCQVGDERIDAWKQEVSAEFELECHRLRSSGIDIPPLKHTIIFGSGSTIELVFRQMLVDGSIRKGTA